MGDFLPPSPATYDWRYGEVPDVASVDRKAMLAIWSDSYIGVLLSAEDNDGKWCWCHPDGEPLYCHTGWWVWLSKGTPQ